MDFDNKGSRVGTLNQAGESLYIGSTHVTGGGPVTINNDIRLARRMYQLREKGDLDSARQRDLSGGAP